MRLFIAIELSDAVRGHLLKMQETLRPLAPSASYTRAENLHLTLKFLGEVPESAVTGLCDALSLIRGGQGFELRATAFDAFPPRRPVRILAAGMTAAPPVLIELASKIDIACAGRHIPLEARSYQPHVTLARAKSPIPRALVEGFGGKLQQLFPGPSMSVDRFALIESRLLHLGPQYHTAAQFYI